MTDRLNEGRIIKVPLTGDLQRGQNLKLPPQPPPAQPVQVPVQQPQQPQTGGNSNGGK